MKVLQLRDVTGSGAPLELHPQITVVRNLDPSRRAWLIDVLGRLGGERAVPAEGTIEAHGIRFDLHDEALAVLDLHAPVSMVVTEADLPGHDPASAEIARRRSEATRVRDQLVDELAAARDELTSALAERDESAELRDELLAGGGQAGDAMTAAEATRSRLERELEGARAACERAEVALAESITERERLAQDRSDATRWLETARVRRREAIDAASRAAAAVEEARLDPVDAGRLAAAVTDARERAERASTAVAGADPDDNPAPLHRRLADLERRRGELVRIEAASGTGGGEPVAEALDVLLGASSEASPVVAALALADTWRDLHQQINALEAGVSPAEVAAEERVAAARRSVAEAEADFNQPVLTPEQTAKVEAAHRLVLEAQDRTEGRFGGSRARRRLDELRIDEQRVLERLGFSTYADYMMSSSSRGVGSANRAVLDAARAKLAGAVDALASLPGAADRVRRRGELLARRDSVAPRLAELLGHEPTGPEDEEELRDLRGPVAPDIAALSPLAERLAAAGVDVGPEPYERDDLVLLARAFLAEERAAEARRGHVTAAMAALDRAIDEHRRARDRGETELPQLDPLPELAEPVATETDAADAAALTLREARWAEVEAARAALVDAEAEMERRQVAARRLEELEVELDAAGAAEKAAAEALDEAEGEAGSVEEREERVAASVSDAEATLDEARRAETEVTESLTAAQGSSGAEPFVAAAEASLSTVAAAEQEAAARLADAEVTLAGAVTDDKNAIDAMDAVDRSRLVDDVDWSLLSRLARLRAAGPGGSVPLVLDDPFTVLSDDEVVQVLDRLASMAGAVQVIVVSDRPAIVHWATAGAGHVAVLVA